MGSAPGHTVVNAYASVKEEGVLLKRAPQLIKHQARGLNPKYFVLCTNDVTLDDL